MTQTEAVLRYLQEHGSITTWEAYSKLFITRLSAKIYELKKLGYNFDEEWMTKKNIYGNTCSFKKYILRRDENGNIE